MSDDRDWRRVVWSIPWRDEKTGMEVEPSTIHQLDAFSIEADGKMHAYARITEPPESRRGGIPPGWQGGATYSPDETTHPAPPIDSWPRDASGKREPVDYLTNDRPITPLHHQLFAAGWKQMADRSWRHAALRGARFVMHMDEPGQER